MTLPDIDKTYAAELDRYRRALVDANLSPSEVEAIMADIERSFERIVMTQERV